MTERIKAIGTLILLALALAAFVIVTPANGARPDTFSGKIFFDNNSNATLDAADTGTPGVTVDLYRDLNHNGLIDRADLRLETTTSDEQGDFSFVAPATGSFVIRVNPRSLPHGQRLTTSGQHAVVAPVTGKTPVRYDFGHTTQSFAENQLIIGFHAGTTAMTAQGVTALDGLKVRAQIAPLNAYVVETLPGMTEQLLSDLQRMPSVKYVQRNYLASGAYAPGDPDYTDPVKSYGLRRINAESAWDVIKGSAAITVAVVDSGLSMTHLEFTGRIMPGWDFVNGDADPSDDQGHGTHVAGIIASAMDNGAGLTGLAPEVNIMPVKVLNAANTGTWTDIAAGIVYAADHGAQIINLSLGGPVDDIILLDAVQYATGKGVFLAAAAGNIPDGGPFYPASYDEAVSVTATNSDDVRWTSSNYGDSIDVAAPGAAIWNTVWTSANPQAYASKNGTSMATAYVSGLAALLLSANPTLTTADLRQILQQSAADLGDPGWDPLYGYGRIDAGAALNVGGAYVRPTAMPSPTLSPTATATPTKTPTATPTATPTVVPPYIRRGERRQRHLHRQPGPGMDGGPGVQHGGLGLHERLRQNNDYRGCRHR